MLTQMPLIGIRTVSTFELVTAESLNQLLSGSAFSTAWGQSHWDIGMSTASYSPRNPIITQWRAFLDGRRGQQKLARYYDASRPYPFAYNNSAGFNDLTVSGSPYAGVSNLSVITDRHTVTITSLPANFILTASDYVEFSKDDKSSLHRIIGSVTASSGGVASVKIEPALPTWVTTGANVILKHASCMALLVPKSVKHSKDIESESISFQARSVAM